MAKKDRPNVNKEELTRLITKSLNDQGVEIGLALSELITREFLRGIKYYLQKGYSVELGDLGHLLPSWRRVRVTDYCVETSKVKLDLSDEMKEILNDRLKNDEKYQENVGKIE